MPSFQISDPPAKAELTEAMEEGKPVAKGTVRFSVDNIAGAKRTASVKVVPDKPDDPGRYVVAGSSKTLPTVTTVDFAPSESRTIEVEVTVPRGEKRLSGAFRLRVQKDSEDNDEDTIDSRPVAYEVAEVAAPALAPRPFPWLALVAALALVVIVGGVVAFFIWPRPTTLAEVKAAVVGKPVTAAETAFPGKNLQLVPVVRRKDDGTPGNVNDVAADSTSPSTFYLYYDPGLASLVGQQVATARQTVTDAWKLQSSDKPTTTGLDANVVSAADVTGPDTAQVVALSFDPGFTMESLMGQSSDKMIEVFNGLAGKATATILGTSDDPTLCSGFTKVSSQQPLNASNTYKTGTQFFFQIAKGTMTGLSCRFLPPWVFEERFRASPNIQFRSQ